MHQMHRLRYGAADDVQMLELSYAEGGGLSMLLLLPKKMDGLADLEKRLTSRESAKVGCRAATADRSKSHLPRFKMTVAVQPERRAASRWACG